MPQAISQGEYTCSLLGLFDVEGGEEEASADRVCIVVAMNCQAITETMIILDSCIFSQIDLTQAAGDSSAADAHTSTQAPDEETDAAPKDPVRAVGKCIKITLNRSFVPIPSFHAAKRRLPPGPA